MIETQRPAGTHLPSLILTFASGFGLLVGLLGAVLFGLVALNGIGTHALSQALGNMSLAWSAGLVALLNIPALLYSIPRVIGHPAPRWTLKTGWRLASIGLIVWAVVVAAASLLAANLTLLTVVLLPPLGLLAAGIPVWWLVEFGRRGLHTSPQRFWGAITVTLVATMPLVIIVELVSFLLIGVLLLAWLAGSSPNLINQLQDLALSFSNGSISPETLIQTLSPYLEKPGVILAGLAIFGLIMPLVEELLKTLALWFVPGKRMSEAEGFTLGLISGGAFALVETLNTLPAMLGQEWTLLILARSATSLLHITCGGLVGWGLASAWQRERYFRLGGLFLLAVTIHGTWNLFVQFSVLQDAATRLPLNIGFLSSLAPFVLVLVPLLMLILMIGINRRLRNQLAVMNPALLNPQFALTGLPVSSAAGYEAFPSEAPAANPPPSQEAPPPQ